MPLSNPDCILKWLFLADSCVPSHPSPLSTSVSLLRYRAMPVSGPGTQRFTKLKVGGEVDRDY